LARMQQNASSADGAASLTQALSNHAGQSLGFDLEDGMKILGKVFGNNLGSVVSGLSNQTNTPNDQVSNILAAIAPNLLSVLGQGNAGGNIGNLLGSLLGGGSASSNAGAGGKLLGGLLGKMFKKR